MSKRKQKRKEYGFLRRTKEDGEDFIVVGVDDCLSTFGYEEVYYESEKHALYALAKDLANLSKHHLRLRSKLARLCDQESIGHEDI